MEGKLIKDKNDYFLDLENKIGQLSLKNCQAIENGYDLDDKISKHLEKNDIEASAKRVQVIKELIFEILGDKKFSEKDVINAFHVGRLYQGREGDTTIENYLQSLQQTEWDVIVEMECPQCKEWGYISECRNNCNQKFLQPKLDADGCLILKRK